MFVFTFVAGLFTFQYDKPHFDPLPRLPPNRARTHTDSPVMSRSSFFVMSEILSQFFSVCVGCASRFHHRGKSLSYRTPRRVNPPNLPFIAGSISPFPPRCLRSSNRRFTRKARHDVRAHVRRRVAHIPERQTAPRPVATGGHRTGQLQRSYC